MRALKILPMALALGSIPVTAAPQQQPTPTEVVDKIVAQEQAEVQSLRRYSPIVETYIQTLRPDRDLGAVVNGDKYYLGRAEFAKGVELEPLISSTRTKNKVFGSLANFFSMEFLPRGFLQMIYLDMNGFDREHYKFEYVGREFLGEVRCLVFDVDPLPKGDKGRCVGRIWVEDQDYHIVRFNGSYGGSSRGSFYFNFDSWRENSGKNEWLPAYIYTEEQNLKTGLSKTLHFKAQTRLWGYDLKGLSRNEEFTQIVVDSPQSVKDQTEAAADATPSFRSRLSRNKPDCAAFPTLSIAPIVWPRFASESGVRSACVQSR